MTSASFDRPALARTLIRTAWMSVLLGLGMEVLLLAAAAFFKNTPSAQAIIADAVQKISWSTFVCTGVAVGTAATRLRAPAMGLAGFLAAPAAFYLAKTAHKSVAQALSIAGQTAALVPSPFLLAGIKGLEYAMLGYMIGLLGRKTAAGLKTHLAAGFGVGLFFGGTIVWLMVAGAAEALPLSGIVTRCINEMVFPVGCSLVLFAAARAGKDSAPDRPDVDTPEPQAANA